ncbi:ABC transporter substrate-binding protein [Halalkalibaculum sp. DA3122]|uniref:ABC transporter substrate-binding protein n=1 Tax=Halalkalibaculum sp. DA3122 TaxID=3373607 RepID=UPI003754B08B
MKTLFYSLIFGVILGLMLHGCAKQPETIVIEDSPESPQAPPAPDTAVSPIETADFRQLILGEIHPVPTLDPLFADNNSAKRTLQLLYEGLVRYDRDGEIVPAAAKRWSVGGDSLSYVFTLRNDLYYHDSDIFSSGLGRKVVAGDVKFAFERMARNGVPSDAAELFMAIEGFQPYFQEQHNVLNPAYRQISSVSGIQAPNDTTVAFVLDERDPHFLQKMASPYASVYPSEAVAENPLDFTPVGSGPFELSQQVGDSVYIFSEFENYPRPGGDPSSLDRVDVVIEQNESNLLKALAAGDIHAIPELGPQIIRNILTPQGELSPAYSTDYIFSTPGGFTTYSLLHNPASSVSRSGVRSIFSRVDPAPLSQNIPADIVQVETVPDSVSVPSAEQPSTIYSTFWTDPFQRWFLQQLSTQWRGQPKLQIVNIRTPSKHTALYTSSFVPFYPGHSAMINSNMLVKYTVKQATLSINEIEDLRFNRYPWWINVRTVDMPGIDEL